MRTAGQFVPEPAAGETGRVMTLPGGRLRSLAGIVGEPHVLTGDAVAGFAVDRTGRFRGMRRPWCGLVRTAISRTAAGRVSSST
jgi:hypothetical protein